MKNELNNGGINQQWRFMFGYKNLYMEFEIIIDLKLYN